MCDVSTSTPRPYVPASFRRTVFDSLHSLSHPGIRATQRLVTARFVWPNINSDVRRWAQTCTQCQRSKVQHHTNAPLSTFAAPERTFRPCTFGFRGTPATFARVHLLADLRRPLHTVARSISGDGHHCRNSR